MLRTLLCLGFCLMASSARAGVIYTLDIDHFGGAGPSPYGTVTITDVAAGVVDMTIALTNGNQFVLTGQTGSTVAFNSIQNQTISLVSSTLPGWSIDGGGAPGAFGGNGFGTFEYSLNCCFNNMGGGSSQAGPITMRLSGAGLNEGSFAQLSIGGSPSAFFGVDVIGDGTGWIGATQPGRTTGTSGNLPEPSALLLLGLGLGTVYRRQRGQAPATVEPRQPFDPNAS